MFISIRLYIVVGVLCGSRLYIVVGIAPQHPSIYSLCLVVLLSGDKKKFSCIYIYVYIRVKSITNVKETLKFKGKLLIFN